MLDWAFLLFFVTGTLLFAACLGLCALRAKRVLALPAGGLFCLGFSLTPFVLGLYMMALSLLPGGANKFLAVVPVWLFAGVVLFLNRSMLVERLRQAGRFAAKHGRWVAVAAALAIYAVFMGLRAGGNLPWLQGIAPAETAALFTFTLVAFFTFRKRLVAGPDEKPLEQRELGLIFVLAPAWLLWAFSLFDAYRWDLEAAVATHTGAGAPAKIGIVALAALYGLVLTAPFLAGRALLQKPGALVLKGWRRWRLPAAGFALFWLAALLYLTLAAPLRAWVPVVALAGIAAYLWLKMRFTDVGTALCQGVRAERAALRAWALDKGPGLAFAAVAAIGLAYLLYFMTKALFVPTLHLVDASQYMGESKYFLDNFSPAGFANFSSSANGSVVGTTHHFLWSAYLAFAMLHCKGVPGFGNDAPVMAATVISLLFAAAALAALLSLLRNKRGLVLGIVLFAGLAGTQYILASRSRDGLRMVGLLFFFTSFAGALEAIKKDGKLRPAQLLLVGAGAFCAMASHPINAIAAVPLVAALFIWALVRKQLGWRFWAICAACGLGVLLASTDIVLAYVNTGSLSGDYIALGDVLAGTPYEGNYASFEQGRLLGSGNFLGRIFYMMQRENGFVMFVGLACAAALLVLLLKRALKTRSAGAALLAGLAGLCNFLMLNDFIQWYGFPMTKWLVMNIRYPYHIALFCVVAICALYAHLQRPAQGTAPREAGRRGHAAAKRAVSTLAIAVAALLMVATGGSHNPMWIYMPTVPAISPEYYDHILVDNIYTSYYYNNRCLSLFSPQARDILAANTREELEEALEGHGIQVIAATSNYRDLFFTSGPLHEYLSDSSNFVEVEEFGGDYTNYYISKVAQGGALSPGGAATEDAAAPAGQALLPAAEKGPARNASAAQNAHGKIPVAAAGKPAKNTRFMAPAPRAAHGAAP